MSFVRRAEDIQALREAIRKRGDRQLPIIAKLEQAEALENLEGILAAADGVMVARGDLGVEVSPEAVPSLQKRILQRATAHSSMSITATEMLESMITDPTPPAPPPRPPARLPRARQAPAIAVSTMSGRTARLMSKARPPAPILAFTASETTYRQMGLVWGGGGRRWGE